MHKLLLAEELLFRLYVIIVGNAAIYGANGSTLGLFVKALALGTFVRYDVIDFIAYRNLRGFGIDTFAVGKYNIAFQISTISIAPVVCAFINRCIGALGFASTAIDTFVGNDYGHSVLFFVCVTLRKNNANRIHNQIVA